MSVRPSWARRCVLSRYGASLFPFLLSCIEPCSKGWKLCWSISQVCDMWLRAPGEWEEDWFLKEISLHSGQWGAGTCCCGSCGDGWHRQDQKRISQIDEPHADNGDSGGGGGRGWGSQMDNAAELLGYYLGELHGGWRRSRSTGQAAAGECVP